MTGIHSVHRRCWRRILFISLFFAHHTFAYDVEGIRPNAIGLPEVNVLLRPELGLPPYSGLDDIDDPFTNLRFVFDTGASGVVLFANQSSKLSIPTEQSMGSTVIFSDVGVGGSTDFNVSSLTHMSVGGFDQDPPNVYDATTETTAYPGQYPDMRLQLGPAGSGSGFLGPFGISGIAGVPLMENKISIIQPKFAEQTLGTIHTYIYEPGTAAVNGPGVLPANLHIELTQKSFARFTQTTPPGANGPTLTSNPFIGPDPLAAFEGQDPTLPTSPPGIRIVHNGKQVIGSFLLDTGNQTSSISSELAGQLGVRYVPGTQTTENPVLETFDPLNAVNPGVVIPDQFQLPVTGIAGNVTIAGFFVDTLQMKTREGNAHDDADPMHLNFPDAPVYVQDIELIDPISSDTFVLDGIIGMNYLMASFREFIELFGGFQLGPFETLVLDFDSAPATLGVYVANLETNIHSVEQVPLPLPAIVLMAIVFISASARMTH